MDEELEQIEKNDNWELVPRPHDKSILGTKWIFKNKLNENGEVIRNKAKLVCKGYAQQEGIDFEETFSPVARIQAIRMFLALSSFQKFKVYQMDVNSTFLNGYLEEVYIEKLEGFILENNAKLICRLKKALYGLKQAPRVRLVSWFSKKQSSIALSIAEAEYVATASCCTQLIWMMQTLQDIQITYTPTISILCDNTSAISISKNRVMHSKTKHIPIKYHFLHEQVLEQKVKLEYVPSKEQVADIFTKPLPRETFQYLRQKLRVIATSSCC
eukprot:PITA_01862